MADEAAKLERYRRPHVVPLGGIFVWSLEGLILSGVFLAVTVTSQELLGNTSSAVGGGSTAINIVDISTSSILLAVNSMTVILHLVIANAFNQASYAELAGGLHAAVSNSLCTVTFLCSFTYVSLYVDACVSGSAGTQMCMALFRTTPMPHLVGGIVSVYVMIMFLVSLALAFVSCPHDTPSYVFVSKGALLMGVTAFSWAMPTARSVARHGCDDIDKGAGASLISYTVFSFLLGLAATIIESLSISSKVLHNMVRIVVDGLVAVMAVIIPLSLVGSTESGSTGMTLGIITMVACLVWSCVDIALHAIAIFKPSGPIVPAAVVLGPGSHGPPWGPVRDPAVGTLPSAPEVPQSKGNPVKPIDDSMYAMMKKGDSMPRHTSSSVPPNPNHHQWSSLFLSDDIRQSLRQRGPLPT